MPLDTLTVAYRATPTGTMPVLDVHVVNPYGKEAKLYAIATPHLQRTAIAREWAEAVELSPGAPLELQILQPHHVHNAAMNGHGDPGAPWGPTIQVVPEVDSTLGQPGDFDPDQWEEEWMFSEAMALGHDFLGRLTVTFNGPAEIPQLAA